MDTELIAYLDARFQQIDRRFEQIDRRFERIDQRFEQIDQRFEQIDQRFERVDRRFEQIDQHFERVDQRFEKVEGRLEGLETAVRQTNVLIEGLRGDVHLIAEGSVSLYDRVERFQSEATLVFDQVKGWIEPYYRNLDSRLKIVEGRVEREKDVDVLDSVRRILGKPIKAHGG